jgi:hypothetical protein
LLTIPEELWLLSLKPKTGRVNNSKLIQAITGAVLIELALAQRIQIKGKKQVGVTSDQPLGNAVLDGALAKIKAYEKDLEVYNWMYELSSVQQKRIQDFVAEVLQERGAIELVDQPVLGGLFRRKKWILKDANLRDEVIQRMRNAGLENQEPTLHTLCLMLIAGQTDLVRITESREERSRYQARIRKLVNIVDEPRAAHARGIIVAVLKANQTSRGSVTL